FFQNQLGVIITLIAFLPLILLIFTDKNMDPQTKKVAGGVGAVLAVIAALIGVSYNPASVEQYTEDMNTCAAQIKRGSRPQPVPPTSPPRRRRSPRTPPRWPRRRRMRNTPLVRMSCTGSRRKTEPRSPRRRMSSTSAQP